MKVRACKYIFISVLFVRVLFAANLSVTVDVQYFSGFNSFGDFYEADGGHKLARSASGKLHAVFVNKNGNNNQLIHAYSADGLNFTTTVLTENNGASAGLYNPALAVFGEDVYVVYVDNKSSADRKLSIIKYTADGSTPQSAVVTLNNNNPFYYTDIALDKDGYIYVAATFSTSYKVKIFRSNTPQDITSFIEETCSGGDFNTARAFLPKLATDDGNGRVYLAYELRNAPGADTSKYIAIHTRMKMGSYGVWYPAEKVSPNFRAQHPDIVAHDGKLHLVYSEQPDSSADDCNLRYRIYDTDLEIQSDEIIHSAKRIYSPCLSFAGDTPLIQYVDSADGATHQIKQTAKNMDGTWIAPQILSNTPNAVYVHTVANVTNDLPDVLWYNTIDQKVYFSAKTDTPDMVAPVNGSVIINGGESLTKNPTLQLALSASDAASGVASVNISETGAPAATWLDYKENIGYVYALTNTPNGDRTIYVWFRDKAGNISTAVSATITLDTAAPPGSVTINNGAAYASTINVSLAIQASDTTSGVASMNISNTGTQGAWLDYQP
ncbi:phage tail protein, partial [Candidatus Termititenax persephonae]